MNRFILLTLAGATFGAGPVLAQDQDAAAYKNMTDKATVEYKAARAECDAASGNAKTVCQAQAKVARANADADAAAQHKNTPRALGKARSDVANAEYELAKAKCGDPAAGDRTACLREAKSTQTAALADAKSDTKADAGQSAVAGTRDCDQLTGTEKAGCMARNTGAATKAVVADSVITTKLKADLVKDPDLKAMDVHVETVKGVVILSGFVPSQAQASKAEALARGIDGVSDVKSSLKVKQP